MNGITQWGEIETRPGKRGGIEILARNHERGRLVSVGTVKGATYEKGNSAILRQPEPSFCLSRSELNAAKANGAQFFRPITADKVTYSISLADFERNAEHFNNAFYGLQLRTPLRHFQRIAASAPRNSITDNPVQEVPGIPVPRQMGLFG